MTDDHRQELDDWIQGWREDTLEGLTEHQDEIADGLLSEPVDCVVCRDEGCEFCPKVVI
jgi:hypothetical protein